MKTERRDTRNVGFRALLLTGVGVVALAMSGCATNKGVTEASPGKDGRSAKVASLVQKGDARRRAGDPAGAARFYFRASTLRPDDQILLVKLGHSMHDAGGFKQAETVFRKALVVDPSNREALRGLGNALVAQDRAKDAINYYRAAVAAGLSAGRQDPRAYSGLGVALDMAGDHRAAQQSYRIGLKHNPGDLNLQNNLGLSLAMSGDYAKAIALLETVTRSSGATSKHRQNLALVYGLAGRTDLAERVAMSDLNSNAVRSNLAYYSWLRSAKTGRKTGAAPPANGRMMAAKAGATTSTKTGVRKQMASRTPATGDKGRGADRMKPDRYSLGVDLDPMAPGMKGKPGKQGKGAKKAARPMLPGNVSAFLRGAKSGGYWIQLGSYKTSRLGESAWRKVRARKVKLLGGHGHKLFRADLGKKGIYYRLQVGPFGRKTGASGLCRKLKASKVACFIVRRGGAAKTVVRKTGRRMGAPKKSHAKKSHAKKTATWKSSAKKKLTRKKTRRKTAKRVVAKKVRVRAKSRKSSRAATASKKKTPEKIVIVDKTGKKMTIVLPAKAN